MKLIVLFSIFTSCYSLSLNTKKIPNAPYCSVVRTKYDRANVYSRNFALEDNRWKNSTVVYQLDDGISEYELELINGAIHDLESQTCIKWRLRRGDEVPYVLLTNKHGGCWAWLGEPKNKNFTELNFQSGYCSAKYIIIHEMLHVMGMDHEHNRPDRDDHIFIYWNRITPGFEHNFYRDRTSNDKLPICYLNPQIQDKWGCTSRFVTETFGLEYDTKSIMHYDGKAFTQYEDLPTMVPRKYYETLEANRFLSLTDMKKINTAYCGDKPFPTPGPPPCEDMNPQCSQVMYICQQDKELAKQHCEKSCGLCKTTW